MAVGEGTMYSTTWRMTSRGRWGVEVAMVIDVQGVPEEAGMGVLVYV